MVEAIIKVIERPDRIYMEETKEMRVAVNGKKIIVAKTWKDDKWSIRTSHSFKAVSVNLSKGEKEALDNYLEDFEW